MDGSVLRDVATVYDCPALRNILPDSNYEQIKLQSGEILVLDTLPRKIAMAAFKRLFGGGIQAHLHGNPLLHKIFGLSPEEGQRGAGGGGASSGRGASGRRRGEAAKGRDAERRNERAHKSSSRLSLVTMD